MSSHRTHLVSIEFIYPVPIFYLISFLLLLNLFVWKGIFIIVLVTFINFILREFALNVTCICVSYWFYRFINSSSPDICKIFVHYAELDILDLIFSIINSLQINWWHVLSLKKLYYRIENKKTRMKKRLVLI